LPNIPNHWFGILDDNFNVIDSKCFASSSLVLGYGFYGIESNDGGLVLVGTIWGTDSSLFSSTTSPYHPAPTTAYFDYAQDIFAMKIDTNFNINWRTFVGGNAWDRVEGLPGLAPNGDIVFTVSTASHDGDFIANVPLGAPTTTLYPIITVSLNGNTGAKSLQYYAYLNSSASGRVQEWDMFFTPQGERMLLARRTDTVHVVKTDAAGGFLWHKKVPINRPVVQIPLFVPMPNGNFCMHQIEWYNSNPQNPIARNKLVMYDANFNELYSKYYSDSSKVFYSFSILPDSSAFIATGSYEENGQTDILIGKIDLQGNLLWTDHFGGSGLEERQSICDINKNTGELTLYALSTSADGDLAPLGAPMGGCDWWLFRLSSVLSQNELDKNLNFKIVEMQNNIYKVSFENASPNTLTLTDALGKNIANYTATSTELNIDLTKYQQGIYFLSAAGYKTQKLRR
jgi:hypothetical protein